MTLYWTLEQLNKIKYLTFRFLRCKSLFYFLNRFFKVTKNLSATMLSWQFTKQYIEENQEKSNVMRISISLIIFGDAP
jgi:hypothetical protein